ncbi:MAG: DUF2693 domain-containing protein [Bacteroidales bacterium]|nr:DUF2693 domain-containing protein [Bacteroidales bacterium]
MNTIITTTTNNALVAAHIETITRKLGSPLMGMSKAMLIEEAKRQMRIGVCHFIYTKKNGEVREAMGTLNRSVLNATLKGTGNSPEEWGCCYYHDCIKGGARSFRWQNLVAVLS